MRIYRDATWVALILAVASAGAAHAAQGALDHEQMLRRLIDDAAHGRIAYQSLSPQLAQAVRGQATIAQSELSALGPLEKVRLASTRQDGTELYRTVFRNGVLEWAFHVDTGGLIDNAMYRKPKPGTN